MATKKETADAEQLKTAKKSVKEQFLELQEKLAGLEQGDEGFEETLKEFKDVSKIYYSERVTVKLPRPRGGEDKRLFVGVNGIGYLIERGKEVEVPRAVAEVIERSEEQANINFENSEALSRSFTDDPRSN